MKTRSLAALVLLVAFASSCVSVPYQSGQIYIQPAPVNGRPAPDFAVSSPDLEGLTKLSDLRGQVVLVNFWASWCGFCRREMPIFESAHQDFKDQGLLILGVNVGEDWNKVETFRREVPFSFPITLDQNSEIFKSYWGVGIPMSFVVDRNGFVIYAFRGEMTEEHLKEVLRQAGFTNP